MSEVKVEIPLPLLEELVESLKNVSVPYVEIRKEYFITEGWKQITFSQPFSESPVIAAFYESKEGWYVPEYFRKLRVELPSIGIPKAPSIPPFSIDIPTVPHPELEVIFADHFGEFSDKFLDKITEYFGLPTPDFVHNAFRPIFRALGAELARAIEEAWDENIKKQVDKVSDELESSINSKIEEIRSAINSGLKQLRDTIASVVGDFKDKVQSGLNEIIDDTSVALNKSIDKLYEMMKLPKGVIVRGAPIRNVSATGFEVYAVTGTLHWIAMGGRQLPFTPLVEKLSVYLK